jgi:hypothetical protein
MENAIEHKDIVLGAFLGIQGAFDITSLDIIKQAAERHDIEPVILINGKIPSHCVRGLTNSPVHSPKVVRTNLSINPNKMVSIPFTRKKEIQGLKKPILFNKTIQLSSEVKYLRITLNKGLTWEKTAG